MTCYYSCIIQATTLTSVLGLSYLGPRSALNFMTTVKKKKAFQSWLIRELLPRFAFTLRTFYLTQIKTTPNVYHLTFVPASSDL